MQFVLESKERLKPSDTGANSIVWQSKQIRPHIVTPIVYGDYLYACTDNGILSQYQAQNRRADVSCPAG